MSEKTQNQAQSANVTEVTRSQDHRYIYINTSRSQATAFDVQLTCSRITFPSSLIASVEEQVTLIMSVAEAKAVRDALDITIKQYEKLFGETPYMDAHKPVALEAPQKK